jgi:hypothetical protein
VVLAALQGLIIGAFIAHDWLPATTDNFPDREEVPGRYGFVGEEAPEELQQRYVRIKRIRQIQLAGFEVAHMIHRHGMHEQTAFEVEAALIDAYPGLTRWEGCLQQWCAGRQGAISHRR